MGGTCVATVGVEVFTGIELIYELINMLGIMNTGGVCFKGANDFF